MQQTIVVPYLRATPLYQARRDLVLSSAESLALRVTVVESDNPTAPLLTLTGGLGGPAAQLTIWSCYDDHHRSWDYGRPRSSPLARDILWSAVGAPQAGCGSFDWYLSGGTLYSLPRRCGWAVHLIWDGGGSIDALFEGVLHVGIGFGPSAETNRALLPLLTDDDIPVHTDTDQPVLT
jgi:hypothetical protein